jgi:putative colanic acid biosynthesis UDP-glucose lipid carrier transferase
MYMMEALHDTTVSIYYVPDVFVFDLIQSRATDIDGVPVVAMRETPFHGYQMIAKRILDVVLAVAMIIVLAPVVAVAAMLIKLSSPGPVIFKQRRYGLDGDEIYVYKLRTMRVVESGEEIVQATRGDSRVTRIGRFLRRSSMDELPQLFNVLQGKMSLVGPRPHAVAHNEQYRRLIKGYMVRHKALPGITGLAQVSGCRGETERLEEMERRVSFDLDYLRSWSLILDLQILLLTVVKVWRDEKAY